MTGGGSRVIVMLWPKHQSQVCRYYRSHGRSNNEGSYRCSDAF